ncbi:MAG: TAXI family TRAP transporter solute-binding subunit, partial [Synergistaceae bacterium]|nr:TAXI family TRAP transporter solute-binding subunit [Synergistaceae bacterium]
AVSIYIATGGTAGTYYPVGNAIAEAVSKNTNLQVCAGSSINPGAHLILVAAGEYEMAFFSADVTAWAFNGEIMFEGNPLKNIRAVAALYPETLHIIAKPGIKDINQLIGKRVAVGAPGSGTEGDARTLLNSIGLTYYDMKAELMDFGGFIKYFKDDKVDAGFVVAGVPTSAIMDLATTEEISLINFDRETMDKIIAANPYFVPNVIPAGTYRGIYEDVITPAVMALLITNEDMPEDVIYNFCKGMFENIDEVQNSHPMARYISLENALHGITAPLHPGAAKFYKEMGLDVK